LIASLPVYRKAGALVLSSFATTGDISDFGALSFRLFPPDQYGAVALFEYAAPRFQKVAFLTSEDDYTELMERWFRKTARERGATMMIKSGSLSRGQSDFRPVLTTLKRGSPDIIVINVNGESDFVTAVKQARELGITCPLTGFYVPASHATIQALGTLSEGMEFINLPLLENTSSSEGKRVMDEYRRRCGEPQSIQLGVALTIESFRLLDRALSSGMAPEKYLRGRSHDSLVGPISFNEHGEVRGVPFQLQKIINGKVEVVK
jgi:branched-chain amino acid transport system substrate-binding protein